MRPQGHKCSIQEAGRPSTVNSQKDFVGGNRTLVSTIPDSWHLLSSPPIRRFASFYGSETVCGFVVGTRHDDIAERRAVVGFDRELLW